MNQKKFIKFVGIFFVLLLLIIYFPIISGNQIKESYPIDTHSFKTLNNPNNATVICQTYGFSGEPTQKSTISFNEAEYLLNMITDLQNEISDNPYSTKVQQLQHEIILFASGHHLIPKNISIDTLQSRLYHTNTLDFARKIVQPIFQNRASQFFCNYFSTGSGSSLPIFTLPRLIPILFTPIPRLFIRWSALEGWTTCGGLFSGTGFIASGPQNGFALGFWGIGFSIFLPPVMAYAIFGYALFATVNAEHIELWPPNRVPLVSDIYPPNGAVNIPKSLTELRFRIDDADGDLMNFTVTTDPDIGSGSGFQKENGEYSVPISGLEGLTEYSWHISVSDDKDSTEENYYFITEAIEPIITNPTPPNDARNIPLDLSQLSFTVTDYQEDPIDWTVETVPDIGSESALGVGNGVYTIDVSGIEYNADYVWYVNATDGENWARKIFQFRSRPEPASWWDENWTYRKEFIVDYSQIEGFHNNFPVLIKLDLDDDLSEKAQDDGDDIVFVTYNGKKLTHEIELFDNESGSLISWVNITSFTSDTLIYMYYGNSFCSNQQDIKRTWDSHYLGVWHMSDISDSIKDSTNHRNGVSYGNPKYLQNGKIHKCIYFDGDGDFFDISDDIYEFANDDVTIETWINIDENRNEYESIIYFGDTDWYPDIWLHKSRSGINQGRLAQTVYMTSTEGNLAKSDSSGAELINHWISASGIICYSDNELKLFIDGDQQIDTDTCLDYDIGSGNHFVGRIGYSVGSDEFMKGYIDEVRVSNIKRDAQWIKTEYNNQNSPSQFFSIGQEEIST